MNRLTAAIYARGERRIRERRVAPVSDETTRLVNLLTEDRDRLRRENVALRTIVHEQARLLDLTDMRSPASRSTLHGAVEDSEGAGGRVQEN